MAAAATSMPATIIQPTRKATLAGATCRVYSYSADDRGNIDDNSA